MLPLPVRNYEFSHTHQVSQRSRSAGYWTGIQSANGSLRVARASPAHVGLPVLPGGLASLHSELFYTQVL